VNLIISLSLSFPPVFLWAREDEEHYLVASPTVCWYYDNLNGSNVLHWIGHPKIPDPLSRKTPPPPQPYLFFSLFYSTAAVYYKLLFGRAERIFRIIFIARPGNKNGRGRKHSSVVRVVLCRVT
jgi:hypothetical protein